MRQLEQRLLDYSELSTTLANFDNAALARLFDSALETSQGWGTNHVMQIGEHKLFVKRILLPERMAQQPYSTKNWYELPLYYNYPVGSAGINPFRELAAHVKTTDWVRSGQCAHFPLLYHHRIVSRQPTTDPINEEGFQNYVAHWNSSEQVREYILARRGATHELVLFLEHFPYELGKWFQHSVTATESIVRQMKDVLQFTYSQGFIHFDLTFNNILSDGEQVYLTDFGLSLDRSFELDEDERAFCEQHAAFDFGVVLKSLAFYAVIKFRELSAESKAQLAAEFNLSGQESLTSYDKSRIIEKLEAFAASGHFPIEQSFVDTVLQYHDIILLIQDFIGAMLENRLKDTAFEHERLERLLRDAGFLLRS